jgi:cell division septation protein DedD
MPEPQDSTDQESATLQLMVEFRNLWLAQEAVQSAKSPAQSPPPARRLGSRAVLLLLVAVVASALLNSGIWAGSHPMSLRLPWAGHRDTATPAVTSNAVRPPAQSIATSHEAGASEPSLQTAPQQPAGPGTQAVSSTRSVSVEDSDRRAAYHVQVGAFNVREYAQDLMRQLRARSYSVTMVEAPTRPPHRVWIEGVFDRDAAEQLVSRLRNDGFEAIPVRP